MKQASKNSTHSGTSRKKTNSFRTLRLYLIFGSIVVFGIFAVYTQILIHNAKQEQEYVPRIFAQYIAYSDGYLRQAEQYSQMIGELSSNYFKSVQKPNFNSSIGDYILYDFMPHNPLPIIITDTELEPLYWSRVGVDSDSSFAELSPASRQILFSHLGSMERIPIDANGVLTNYVFFAKPISLRQFLSNIDYSVVVTDRDKNPLYWRNMDIPETLSWYDIPPSQREQVSDRLAKMTEIPLSNAADSLGYIYFTAPKSLSRIQSVFVLEIFLALLLIAFSSYGLFLLHRTEKDTLWIGLAKETAHQFGTPITSLMGWIDYLKESPGTGHDRPGMDRIIEYMTADLNQLRMIASRFGKVGSQTNLVPTELNAILAEMVDYFQQRMPHLGSRIDIHLISKIQGVQVMLDPELFKWTLENLIKNCVDAMTKKGGSIIITASKSERHIYVQVRDEGKGIPRSQWKRIFDPGVTTKTRGWGLGLSLAKRIIEEYHQGQIRVVQSVPNEGTTFEIKLPIQSNSKR
ncbi:MAG TPA: HAMP domain-containing sensor histidine kinase [Candidatus Cloacimonadota bacterium]|jgi:hypothetical protein|nr:HAMP domain-containing sensor histidine kinase [Candidatus Cloacimonadota bacterium]HOR59088.1 HAMP domain-containing sensor histidine kinase [Candidatus Cloacimonadota bacterium]HPB08838.1 HAMP domain-containing sensor histidine kinase [Candidatus Cloacimonadota bacterium]HPL23427.1 HAMP domain-containing sensor histidine kinase [Candidatus Cloacimonadota bacterium]HQL13931.1 HAMP domain-containing sensor histidine kinase [Candidatus Cloacimonadota bacterium]